MKNFVEVFNTQIVPQSRSEDAKEIKQDGSLLRMKLSQFFIKDRKFEFANGDSEIDGNEE